MKILIVYGTIEGHTRKIARFMESALENAGHKVTIADATDHPPHPSAFDAVLIGASVHMQRYPSAVMHYVRQYAGTLNSLPGAFFSVCLAITSTDEEEHREAAGVIRDFLDTTGWKPVTTTIIAGALKYTQYDFFKRMIMKMISKQEGRTTDTSKDFEYTNWKEAEKFVLDFADTAEKSRSKKVNT